MGKYIHITYDNKASSSNTKLLIILPDDSERHRLLDSNNKN